MSEERMFARQALVFQHHGSDWVEVGGHPGHSTVHLLHHTSNQTYRVVAMKNQTQECVINSIISKSFKFKKATPTFFQWREPNGVYGINFSDGQDAEAFEKLFNLATQEHEAPLRKPYQNNYERPQPQPKPILQAESLTVKPNPAIQSPEGGSPSGVRRPSINQRKDTAKLSVDVTNQVLSVGVSAVPSPVGPPASCIQTPLQSSAPPPPPPGGGPPPPPPPPPAPPITSATPAEKPSGGGLAAGLQGAKLQSAKTAPPKSKPMSMMDEMAARLQSRNKSGTASNTPQTKEPTPTSPVKIIEEKLSPTLPPSSVVSPTTKTTPWGSNLKKKNSSAHLVSKNVPAKETPSMDNDLLHKMTNKDPVTSQNSPTDERGIMYTQLQIAKTEIIAEVERMLMNLKTEILDELNNFK